MDADHRCLERIVNLLDDVVDADAPRVIEMVLDTLTVYARYHFAREEQLMMQWAFPALAHHRLEHDNFSKTIAGFQERHLSRATAQVARDLRDYLMAWLLHHVLIQDMAYKPFAQRDAIDSDARVPADALPSILQAACKERACQPPSTWKTPATEPDQPHSSMD